MGPVRNSGQTAVAAPPVSSVPAPSPAPIYVGSNGYIHGIDGMLDQISGALVKQAMPIIQQDRSMQETIGYGAGKALAKPLWVLSGIAAVWVGWQIYQSRYPRVRRRTRRSTR